MPTYGFKCPAGHEFDRFYRKMSDSVSELPCPTCGETAVRQMHGGAGLVFKGSGFYLTDYGKNAHRTGTEGKAADKAVSTGEKPKGGSGDGGSGSSGSSGASGSGGSSSAPASPSPKSGGSSGSGAS